MVDRTEWYWSQYFYMQFRTFPVSLSWSLKFEIRWKPCACLVSQLSPTLCNPKDCSPPGSPVHGDSQARILQWISVPSSRGSSQPRDQTQASHIAGRFFTIWVIWEAQEYWVGSISLLQGIFPTQEMNQGLLCCRQILYQLSHQGRSRKPCGSEAKKSGMLREKWTNA